MRGLVRRLGDWATKIETWWALGGLMGGAGFFGWLLSLRDAVASHGWAAVVFLSIISSCLLGIVVFSGYLALARFRADNYGRALDIPASLGLLNVPAGAFADYVEEPINPQIQQIKEFVLVVSL
jgi:hypothetical protein